MSCNQGKWELAGVTQWTRKCLLHGLCPFHTVCKSPTCRTEGMSGNSGRECKDLGSCLYPKARPAFLPASPLLHVLPIPWLSRQRHKYIKAPVCAFAICTIVYTLTAVSQSFGVKLGHTFHIKIYFQKEAGNLTLKFYGK